MASSEPPAKKARTESEEERLNKTVTYVREILEKAGICQVEIEKLNDQARKEILEVEQKYNKLRKPYFRQRNDYFKRIPRFWMAALTQHPHLSTIIQPEEKDCLRYITDLVAEDFEDIRLGYQISFYFKENPYFENKVITKTMHLASTAHARSESTPIKWKKGKDLIFKYSEKIARCVKRKSQIPATFFSWFSDNSNPTGDEVAETIKEDLWPSAVQYFLGPDVESKNGKNEYEQTHGSSDEGQEGVDEEEEEYEEYSEEEIPEESEDMSDGEEKDKPDPVMKEDSIAEAELEGRLGGDDDSQSYYENESEKEDQEQVEEMGEHEYEEIEQEDEETSQQKDEEMSQQKHEEMDEENDQECDSKEKDQKCDNKEKDQGCDSKDEVAVMKQENMSKTENEDKSQKDIEVNKEEPLECSKAKEGNGKSSEDITTETNREKSPQIITDKTNVKKSSEDCITKAIVDESPDNSETKENGEVSLKDDKKGKTLENSLVKTNKEKSPGDRTTKVNEKILEDSITVSNEEESSKDSLTETIKEKT